MSKTYLGYYGMLNLGDDLMLKTLLETGTNEKRTVIQFKDNPLPGQDKNIKFLTWPDGKFTKITFALRLILQSKEVIFGGGTCFTDEDGDGFFKYMVMAKLLGKKVKYKAIGIGNLKRKSRIFKTKILLSIADEITVRDEQSFNRAKKFTKDKKRIVKEDDLAIKSIGNIIKQEKFTVNRKDPYLALGWRDLKRYDCKEWNDPNYVVDYILKLAKEKGLKKIVMFDVDSYFDADINQTLYDLLVEKTDLDVVYNKSTDIIEKMKVICESNFVFTSRLHVAVIAEEANLPCEALNYSPKIQYYVDEVRSQHVKVVLFT
ncbi:polysaccharide pyruvyl transferase family protein [Metabacillus sp. Hm71]|uniref:polysaccharide pyruvyl transferase family protein n=1 Tax=Metabacillus sp. Hm71 TaxID=3450743 RepID=UPI003F434D91